MLDLEPEIKIRAMEYLEKGKPGWDVLNTLASVHRMRKLIDREDGDDLVTTMYLHDIGYSRLFKKDISWNDIIKSNLLHMTRGAEFARKILKDLDFSDIEGEMMIHLILVHDKLDLLSRKEEQLVRIPLHR